MKKIALVGNPNAGKSTIFNALTGLRQKVGNYPGITVERKTGSFYDHHGKKNLLIDLPGSYSLSSRSPDEAVTRESLMGFAEEFDHPDIVVIVLDATNIERHLYLATQTLELGIPSIVVLNMMDLARDQGILINVHQLSQTLDCPVVEMTASQGQGLTELKVAISKLKIPTNPQTRISSPIPESISPILKDAGERALQLGLCNEVNDELRLLYLASHHDPDHLGLDSNQITFLEKLQNDLADKSADWEDNLIGLRYHHIEGIISKVKTQESGSSNRETTDKIDRFLLHPVWGWVTLTLLLVGIFFLIFSVAQAPMGWIENIIGILVGWIQSLMPPGDFRDLLTDGILAGIEGVIIFLPQILILFFFISLMEETGYMARVAFLMDRVMGKVGLNGKSFVPLLSSYACAVPGVMAARSIENAKDRLITILVVPLASCSARLPVYLLMIATLVPDDQMSITTKVLVLIAMYALGTIGAFVFAWFFRKTLSGGAASPMVLELPSYRIPRWKSVGLFLMDRALIFVRRAGTIILGLSILLWAATTYPKLQDPAEGEPEITSSQALEHSLAGRLGKIIEPVVQPLGYDWKIGIGVITSFAAREVFVSTMAIIYSVEEGEEDAETQQRIRDRLSQETRDDGSPLYTPLVCISLMVFYVFAMQCLSTVAVVKRETGGWKWPLFQIAYMTIAAYLASLIVFQGGKLFGFS